MIQPAPSYQFIVAGSGFSGSLTALALAQCGHKVLVVEKGSHPRFAIGESSTPIADMILRSLSDSYDLPWLYPFSRYGSWQQSYPHVASGLKRGFSYFKHHPGHHFSTSQHHSHELLVAASVNNDQSDTHWFRADVDAFFAAQLKSSRVDYFDRTEIISLQRDGEWIIRLLHEGQTFDTKASFLIDATGSPALLNDLLGVKEENASFHTDSFAIFSHYQDLPRWSDYLSKKGISNEDYPYDPDDSALHQVLDEGWVWMLRFNNRITSVGLTLRGTQAYDDRDTQEIWNTVLAQYPSLWNILESAQQSAYPGKLMRSKRLQRRLRNCVGEGWVALPHTTGFIDPLHSTGIAFSLSGIERLVPILTAFAANPAGSSGLLKEYEQSVFAELSLIDKVVAGCYLTFDDFELFNVWTMCYFIAAITYERERLSGKQMSSFLCADNSDITAIIYESFHELTQLVNGPSRDRDKVAQFMNRFRNRIKPFNSAGLLDPSARNMYRHSAAIL